jgi:hypothetical protein
MGKNQILKKQVDFFNEYLEMFGTVEKNYILINPNHFKKVKYNGLIKNFTDKLEPFYHESKKYYIQRENITYMQFITILRQIAHTNGVFFEYKIKYTNSKHYMEYYFYPLNNSENNNEKIENDEIDYSADKEDNFIIENGNSSDS